MIVFLERKPLFRNYAKEFPADDFLGIAVIFLKNRRIFAFHQPTGHNSIVYLFIKACIIF